MKCTIFICRFFASEIRQATKEMRQQYHSNIVGKVALAVFHHHKALQVIYELSTEAQDYFDTILDNLASQFNSHYDMEKDLTESQPVLSDEQRADIDVRTKAAELIGRLSAILWIYNNGKDFHIETCKKEIDMRICSSQNMKPCHPIISAFTCIAQGKPFFIPWQISLKCMKSAESIVNTSYSQAEVYSSICMHS